VQSQHCTQDENRKKYFYLKRLAIQLVKPVMRGGGKKIVLSGSNRIRVARADYVIDKLIGNFYFL